MSARMEAIRSYLTEDEAQVVALWGEAFGYPQARNAPAAVIAEYLRGGRRGLLVAADGPRVLGTIMVGYDGHRGWLYRLAVAASARRRGVARRLAAAAVAHLRAEGCKKVNVQLHSDNGVAHAFWRSVGLLDEPRISMGMDLTSPDPASARAPAFDR